MKTRQAIGWCAVLVVFSWIWLRNAWITDDAFITFRSIEQLLVGNGLRFNPHERVQAFTHPLWLGLLLALRVAGLPLAAAAFLLSWLAVAAALLLAFRMCPGQPARGLLFAGSLLGSRVLMDFSSSGLETPLSILLLVLFGRAVLMREASDGSLGDRSVTPIFFLAAALLLTRHDHGPLVVPVLALLAVRRWERGRLRCGAEILLGLMPFVAWSLFSCLYYGSLVPNTALAKLGAGVPRAALFVQGLHYVEATALWDPLWIALLVAGGFAAVRSAALGKALGIGAVLHMSYVVAIGGDFMVGRFWVPSTVVALVLAVEKLPDRAVRGSLAGVLAVCLFWPQTALFTDRDHRPGWRLGAPGKAGIVDEKGNPPGSQWLRDLLRDGWPQPMVEPPGPPRIAGVLGRPGYRAHPQQILVDLFALSDPFLARLPYEPPWQIGHFRRRLPAGYLASLEAGSNRIQDPALAALYDDVRVVASAPLFDRERFWSALRLIQREGTPPRPDARCPLLTVGLPGGLRGAERRVPVLAPAVEVDDRTLLLRGVAPLGEQAGRWRLAVGVEPLPAGALLRCVPAPSTAALALEVELVYEDARRARVAAGSAPSLHLVLVARDAPDG